MIDAVRADISSLRNAQNFDIIAGMSCSFVRRERNQLAERVAECTFACVA